jgi:hypothetical protein
MEHLKKSRMEVFVMKADANAKTHLPSLFKAIEKLREFCKENGLSVERKLSPP